MGSRCRNCCYKYILQYMKTLLRNSNALITKTYNEGKPLPIGTFVLKRIFTQVHFTDKLKLLLIGPYKILDRLSDVTSGLFSQNGSTLYVHRNHLMPYYPREPILYPHLRSFMCFSDSTQFNNSKPIKYAISDSSLFNSDESLSDEDSSQKSITPSTTSNYDLTPPFSNDNSSIKLCDNSPFKKIITTPQNDIPIARSPHPSQNQSNSFHPPINRTTKTHYNLRQQPKIDYILFIPPSKF